MNGGIRLGRIFDITITLDYSWFIIFALITFGLSFSLLPQLIPGLNLTTYVLIGAITSIFFFASVLFHELMHSIVAKRNGLEIEEIRLLIFGGVSEIQEEPPTPGIEFRMALAGPVSSIFLGAIFLGLFFVGRGIGLLPVIIIPAFWLGYINIILGVFNLLPGFPLDGGRVLRSAVWYFTGSLRRATGIAAGFGKGLAYLMITIGILGLVTGFFNLIWFTLLGWYLLRAAEAGYQAVVYHEALEGVKVSQIMTENPETVDPDITIEDMVKEHFVKHNWVAYPVVEDGKPIGMITIKSIQNLPRSAWRDRLVRDVMRPLSPIIATDPDTEVFNILPKLSTKSEGRMLVIKDERLAGILTETDVRRALVRILHIDEEDRRRTA